jgi:hypothetical protein
VPALMLECQLSGLFRHCSDVPGDIALDQPGLLFPWIVFNGASRKEDRERRPGN